MVRNLAILKTGHPSLSTSMFYARDELYLSMNFYKFFIGKRGTSMSANQVPVFGTENFRVSSIFFFSFLIDIQLMYNIISYRHTI